MPNHSNQLKTTLCPAMSSEILLDVFKNLKLEDKKAASDVCTPWREILKNKHVFKNNEYTIKTPEQNLPGLVKKFVIEDTYIPLRRFPDAVSLRIVMPPTLTYTAYEYAKTSNWSLLNHPQNSLVKLELDNVILMDDGILKQITVNIPNLKVLIIRNNSVLTNEGIKYISKNLKKLMTLRLENVQNISSRSLQHLAANRPQLECIELSSCPLLKIGKAICDFHNLKELTYRATDKEIFYNCDFTVFASLTKLTKLAIEKCYIDKEMIDFLAQKTRLSNTLKTLSISNCLTFSENILHSVSELRQLRSLDISGSSGIVVSAVDLTPLSRLSKLRELKMQELMSLSNDVFLVLQTLHLQDLDIAFCAGLSTVGVNDIIRTNPHLDRFVTNSCNGSVQLVDLILLTRQTVRRAKALEVVVWDCRECSLNKLMKGFDFVENDGYIGVEEEHLELCFQCGHDKKSHFTSKLLHESS